MVALPEAFICQMCSPWVHVETSMAVVSIESLIDDDGELVGLRSVARYPICGHRMPQVRMGEEDVAWAMEVAPESGVLRAFPLDDEAEEE